MGSLCNGLVIVCALVAMAGLFFTTCNKHHDVKSTRVDISLVADGFVSPIGVVAVPDNTGRLFVIDQAGSIWIIDSTGTKLPTAFYGHQFDDRSHLIPTMTNEVY